MALCKNSKTEKNQIQDHSIDNPAYIVLQQQNNRKFWRSKNRIPDLCKHTLYLVVLFIEITPSSLNIKITLCNTIASPQNRSSSATYVSNNILTVFAVHLILACEDAHCVENINIFDTCQHWGLHTCVF